MAFQILSIPRCVKRENNWILEIYGITPSRAIHKTIYPIAATPKLPIGGAINPDQTISRYSGNTKQIRISEFSSGRIISVDDLDERLYSFDVPDEITKHTKLFEVESDGRAYIFFCYEIFRAFLCWENSLIKYLFQYDALDSFIDNESIQKVGASIEATLEINDFFPKNLLRNSKKLEKYILLVYQSSIRSLRQSILSKRTDNSIDFSFTSFDFKNLILTCQVKEYSHFTLVYSVNSIDSPIDFPFDRLTILHSGVKSKDQENSGRNTSKTMMPFNHATSHDTDNDEAGNRVSHEDFSVQPLEYKFDRQVQIEKKQLSNSESNKDKREPIKIPKHQLKDVQFTLLDEDEYGEGTFQNRNRDSEIGTFDYSEVPEGLIPFTKAINILSSTIGKPFSYWLSEFETSTSFSKIGEMNRKAIVVRFEVGSPIYFLEIDSSDDRFISTLLLHSINTLDHRQHIQVILDNAAKNHGRWPEDDMQGVSQFLTLRHPQSRKKDESLTKEEKADKYVERIAWRYLSVFRAS